MAMFNPQENRQILESIINGKRINAVASFLFINFPYISYLTGVKAEDYFNDPAVMMNAQIECQRKLGLDLIISPDFGTVIEANAFGAEINVDSYGIPSPLVLKNNSLDEIANLRIDDYKNNRAIQKLLYFLEYMVSNAPEGVEVASSNVMSPLTIASSLRGISTFCMDTFDEPDLVKDVLNNMTDFVISFLKEQEEILSAPLKRVLISDDISSFFDAEFFTENIHPIYERIFSAFPESQYWLHNDGEALHLAEAISKTKVQLWHVGSCVEIDDVFKRTNENIALCGGLAPITDFLQGSADDLTLKTKELIRKYSSTGRYICSAGGFIGSGTSVENIAAFLNAVYDEHRIQSLPRMEVK